MKATKKQILTAVIVFVVAIAVIAGIYAATKPATLTGDKAITVEVVHKDGNSRDFTVKTDREYLGEVLVDEGIASGSTSEYGLFITEADGYTADDGNQEWWCITKGGEQVNTGADTTPIADGDHFELTLTVGW